MSYSISNVKKYDNGKVVCVEQSSTLGGSTPINCLFVPNKDYPDLSKVSIQLTGNTAWFDTYDEFVPKAERFVVDIVFIIFLLWFLIPGMYKFVKKIFF